MDVDFLNFYNQQNYMIIAVIPSIFEFSTKATTEK